MWPEGRNGEVGQKCGGRGRDVEGRERCGGKGERQKSARKIAAISNQFFITDLQQRTLVLPTAPSLNFSLDYPLCPRWNLIRHSSLTPLSAHVFAHRSLVSNQRASVLIRCRSCRLYAVISDVVNRLSPCLPVLSQSEPTAICTQRCCKVIQPSATARRLRPHLLRPLLRTYLFPVGPANLHHPLLLQHRSLDQSEEIAALLRHMWHEVTSRSSRGQLVHRFHELIAAYIKF